MTGHIDLSDFDPYSPTPSSSTSSSLVRPSSTTSSVPISNKVSHDERTSANLTEQDPLSLLSQLNLGGSSEAPSASRTAQNATNGSSSLRAVRAQQERHSKVLADLARQPFTPVSSSSASRPVPIPTSTSDSEPSSHSSLRHSHSHPRPFSPPRRLSSLMDLGDHTYPQFPQFSPPMSSSPTLEPFHALPSDDSSPSASRRMRQASEDWTRGLGDVTPAPAPTGTTTTSRTSEKHSKQKTRERSVSGDWGDFQTATPPTPGTCTSSPVSSSTPPELFSPPSALSTEASVKRKPSPHRASTVPLPESHTRPRHPPTPTSAASLSSYHLKNLPPPPSAPNSLFDPFNQPVKLVGFKLGGPGSTTTRPILNETIAEGLRPSLPPRLRISPEWRLLYSLDQHGTSILTLFKQVSEGLSRGTGGGFILVVKTDRGQIFGGYVSEEFKSDSGSSDFGSVQSGAGVRGAARRNGLSSLLTGNKVWGGDGSSFLFTTVALPVTDPRISPLIKTYPPTYRNTYFQHSSLHSGIALGGGNDGKFGLWIDERLERGWTGTSETFGNEPLTGPNQVTNGNGNRRNDRDHREGGGEEEIGKFEIVGLECWAVGG